MNRKPITPGRLAKWGAIVLVIATIYGFWVYTNHDNDRALWTLGDWLFYAAGILFALAGIAKAVQIGVRSAKD